MQSVVIKVALKGNGHPRARLTPDLTPPSKSPTTPPGVESITSTARCVGKSAVRVATPWNIPGGDKPVRGYCPPDGCWISSLSIQRRSYNNGGQQNLLSCQQRRQQRWRRAAVLLKLPVQHSGKKFHFRFGIFFYLTNFRPQSWSNLGQEDSLSRWQMLNSQWEDTWSTLSFMTNKPNEPQKKVKMGEQQQTGGGLDWTSSQLDQIPKSFSLE